MCGNEGTKEVEYNDLLEETKRELPRGERQGGDVGRYVERVQLTALVPVPI